MNIGRTLPGLYSRVRPDSDPARIELGEDALYELMADSRRRFVVDRLADGPVESCAELAADIAAHETHMAKEQVPPRRVEPVERDLRDEQLPRLADAGVVRWDEATGRIRPGHSIEAIADLLHEVDRRIDRGAGAAGDPFAFGATTVDWRSACGRSSGDRHR